jgi:hypothetical protein
MTVRHVLSRTALLLRVVLSGAFVLPELDAVKDQALHSTFEAEPVLLQTAARPLLETSHRRAQVTKHEEEKDSLVCYMDGKADAYQYEHMSLSAGWGNPSKVSTATLASLGYPPLPDKSWYTAKNVHAELLSMLGVLGDFSKRTNNTYWLMGGALIGALRTGTLIPWDEDIDFCLEKKAGDTIRHAYGSPEVPEIMPGFIGKSVGDVNKDWKDYWVAFNPDGSEVYVFSMKTGLKMEMVYNPWLCYRGDLALPVQSIPVENTMVNIPAHPLSWLRYGDRYSCSNFDSPGAFLMYTDKYTSCMKCPASSLPALPAVDSKKIGSPSQTWTPYFVFGAQKTDGYAFEGRQHLSGLPLGCVPTDGNPVNVLVMHNMQSGFQCMSGISWQESVALLVAGIVASAAIRLQFLSDDSLLRKSLKSAAVCLYSLLIVLDYSMIRMVADRHGGIPFSVLSGSVAIALGKLPVALTLSAISVFRGGLVGDDFALPSLTDCGSLVAIGGCAAVGGMLHLATLNTMDLATFVITLEVWIVVVMCIRVGRFHSANHAFAFAGVAAGILSLHLGEIRSPPATAGSEGIHHWKFAQLLWPALCAGWLTAHVAVQESMDKASSCLEMRMPVMVLGEVAVCGVLLCLLEPWHIGPGFFEIFGLLWEVRHLFMVRSAVGIATLYMVKYVGGMSSMVAMSIAGPLSLFNARHFDILQDLSNVAVFALVLTYISGIFYWSSLPPRAAPLVGGSSKLGDGANSSHKSGLFSIGLASHRPASPPPQDIF